jgi:hypothetical protein
MVKSRLALFFLLAPHFLHGMKNNDRALTTSSASSLMRTVGSYGPVLRLVRQNLGVVGSLKSILEKPVIFSLFPLAVGCMPLQNASMPDAHYVPIDQEPYGGTIGTLVIGFVGTAVGVVWIGTCAALFNVFRKNACCGRYYNTVDDDDALYPTIAIDIKNIMHSRTSNPDADNVLAFGQRYGSGNLHHFFGGCYGDYQREVADTIVLCLQQRRVNMPGGLQVQIPHDLVEEIGRQMQHIDWAVLRKLVEKGGHPIYHDPSRNVYRLMTPTLFPWNSKADAFKWNERLGLKDSEREADEVIEII